MSDLIYRQNAIEATWQEPTYTDPLNVLTEVRDRIASIPSADRPRGEWIVHSNDKIGECSECGSNFDNTVIDVLKWNFCPNCGAHMKGADDETD